jgi:circadian clock protein KaiC
LLLSEITRLNATRVVTALTSAGVSVLMTSELEDRYTDLRFSPYGTAFPTDAIIVQRYIEVQSRLLRIMAIVKVRASVHSDELRLYSIDNDSLKIGEITRAGRFARGAAYPAAFGQKRRMSKKS